MELSDVKRLLKLPADASDQRVELLIGALLGLHSAACQVVEENIDETGVVLDTPAVSRDRVCTLDFWLMDINLYRYESAPEAQASLF